MEAGTTTVPPMGAPPAADVESVTLDGPKDIEAGDNDGGQFFEVAAAVGKELGTLSPYDIAGGMRTLGQGIKDRWVPGKGAGGGGGGPPTCRRRRRRPLAAASLTRRVSLLLLRRRH